MLAMIGPTNKVTFRRPYPGCATGCHQWNPIWAQNFQGGVELGLFCEKWTKIFLKCYQDGNFKISITTWYNFNHFNWPKFAKFVFDWIENSHFKSKKICTKYVYIFGNALKSLFKEYNSYFNAMIFSRNTNFENWCYKCIIIEKSISDMAQRH